MFFKLLLLFVYHDGRIDDHTYNIGIIILYIILLNLGVFEI